MTSPKPITLGWSIKDLISFKSMVAPLFSSLVAGTHDGIIIYTFSGIFSLLSSINSMPFLPQTLAISCGSAIIVVVPLGTTTLENPPGVSIEDSI